MGSIASQQIIGHHTVRGHRVKVERITWTGNPGLSFDLYGVTGNGELEILNEWGRSDAFLDEIPGAYKPIGQVMADAAGLVRVEHTLRQIVNVKGVSSMPWDKTARRGKAGSAKAVAAPPG